MELRIGKHKDLVHRIIDERGDLILKWRRIEMFMCGKEWENLDKNTQKLLYKQHSILTEYVLILNDRIQLLINKPIGEI